MCVATGRLAGLRLGHEEGRNAMHAHCLIATMEQDLEHPVISQRDSTPV